MVIKFFDEAEMTSSADRLEIVARFLAAPEAYLARNRLELEGIQTFLDSEHHITMDWAVSNALGGVKLLVRSNDVEIAKKILSQKGPPISNEETGDRTEYDHFLESESCCPKCGSRHIQKQRLSRMLVVVSFLLFGFPLLFFNRKLECDDCHYRWHPY